MMTRHGKLDRAAAILLAAACFLSVQSSSLLWAQDGPPGSGPAVGNDGPPGSQNFDGPPGSRDNDGPPGSQSNDGPPGSGDANRGYFIEEFYRIEATFLGADRVYREASVGSDSESNADYRRRSAYDSAIALLGRIGEVRDGSSQSLDIFAMDMTKKYQDAPQGSLRESLYDQARRAAWPAVENKAEAELRRYGWRRIVGEAVNFDARYQAPRSSLEESTYQDLRSYAWNLAEDHLEREVPRLSYGTLRQLQLEFKNGYDAAPRGSLSEGFYQQAYQAVTNRL
jgi:hypothetical protein